MSKTVKGIKIHWLPWKLEQVVAFISSFVSYKYLRFR